MEKWRGDFSSSPIVLGFDRNEYVGYAGKRKFVVLPLGGIEAAKKSQNSGLNQYFERRDYLNETPVTKNRSLFGISPGNVAVMPFRIVGEGC